MAAYRESLLRRAIVAVLAVAWLPYATLCCIAAPASVHAACERLGLSGAPVEHILDTAHSAHCGRGHQAPASTCCEVSRKSTVRLAVPPVVDPPHPIALAVSLPDVITPTAEKLEVPGGSLRAHAPPPYLRNSVLRI